MHIHTQPVAGAVHVEGLVGFAGDQLIHGTAQQAQLHQAGGDHLHSGFVGGVPVFTGGDFLERRFLGGQHQLVDSLLLGRKGTADREGAGDVAGVAVDLAGGVDQHQIAVFQQRVVLAVMQDAGVFAGSDDRAVGRHLRAALAELVIQLGFQAVLIQSGAAGLHGAYVGTGGNVGSGLHHLHFRRRLVQAHVMQQVVEGDKLIRWLRTLARLGADHVDPLHQMTVEFLMDAEGVIDPLAAFDQARQNLVDVADREGIIGAELADGAILTGTQAIPQLALGVALAAEQHVLAMLTTGDQGQHRFRLGEAGEVLEITVLAVDMFHITVADIHRRGRQNGNAVGLHLRHQRLAPTGIFRFRDAGHNDSRLISAGTVSARRPAAWRTRRTAAAALRAGTP